MNIINKSDNDPIHIAGAGPAGLAAAIFLARANRHVIVHEMHSEVGHRFQGDFQGLENWTTEEDVLSVLASQGIEINFTAKSLLRGTAYDSHDNKYPIDCTSPLFYLIERGPGANSLDTSLLKQAQKLGVEVRFNDKLTTLDGVGILAAGPKAPDAIAVGYHFETNMPDGYWVICDDDLAPEGYAYLLVMDGHGTIKTCMFTGFKKEKIYVERTVETFKRLVDLEMINPVAHGGAGNFRIPDSAYSGLNPVIGEQAGFQDTLWGFGMRLAINSGLLAAESLLTNKNYDELWQGQLRPHMQTSVVNRAFFGLLGNRGYQWLLARTTRKLDIRHALYNLYKPSRIKNLLLPLATRRYKSRRKDTTCNHVDCHCIWCRHCSGIET